MEPDQRVQQAIRQMFSKFAELRSARQVLLWFRTERLSLGRTTVGGESVWRVRNKCCTIAR